MSHGPKQRWTKQTNTLQKRTSSVRSRMRCSRTESRREQIILTAVCRYSRWRRRLRGVSIGWRTSSARQVLDLVKTLHPPVQKRLSPCLSLCTARAVGQASQQTSTSLIIGGYGAVSGAVVQSVEMFSALWFDVKGSCQVFDELLLVLWISGVSLRSVD